MPKYYVEVNCLGNEENYEIWADSKAEAEKIVEEKYPDNAFRWTRVRNEAEKKSNDGLLLTGGAAAVGAIATVLVVKGAWYGVKGLWKGGKLAYQVARNPQIVSDYMETKRQEAEKKKERHAQWVKQQLEENERRQNDPKVLEMKKWAKELNRKMLFFWVPLIIAAYGLMFLFMHFFGNK
jgi:Ribonuclease G/E